MSKPREKGRPLMTDITLRGIIILDNRKNNLRTIKRMRCKIYTDTNTTLRLRYRCLVSNVQLLKSMQSNYLHFSEPLGAYLWVFQLDGFCRHST